MTEGQQKVYNICQNYPFLIPRDWEGNIDTEYDYSYISLGIPQGWAKLFFQMCDDLKAVLEKEGVINNFYFLDVKEKYNELTCFCSHSSPEVDNVLRKYRYISRFICVQCGKPAVYETSKGYIESFCEDCWKNVRQHRSVNQLEFVNTFEMIQFSKGQHNSRVVDVFNEWNRYLESIEDDIEYDEI